MKPLMKTMVTKPWSYISRSWILKAMHFLNIWRSSGIMMMKFGMMLDWSVSTSPTTQWKASVRLQNCWKCTQTAALGPLWSRCGQMLESKIAILWQYQVAVVSRDWGTTTRGLPLHDYNTAVKFCQEVWQAKALILLAPSLTPTLKFKKRSRWQWQQHHGSLFNSCSYGNWLDSSIFFSFYVTKYLYHKSMVEIFFGVNTEKMIRNLVMPT